jgi:phage gp16-like protein
MALKNMIKEGDKVTFGRSGDKKQSGTVVKKNPKTARIKVPRCGEFLVTYNLIQKPRKKVAAKKKTATKRKAVGKQICAVPVKGGRKPRAKKNPSDASVLRSLNVITRSWAKKQKTAQLDALGQALVDWAYEPGEPMSAAQLDRLNKKLDILMDELETRSDWRGGGGTKLNPPRKSSIKKARKAIKRAGRSRASRKFAEKYQMQTGRAATPPVRPADRKKEELILGLMALGMSRAAAKARVAEISQTPREAKPKVKGNPPKRLKLKKANIPELRRQKREVEGELLKLRRKYPVSRSRSMEVRNELSALAWNVHKLRKELERRGATTNPDPRLGGRYGRMVSQEEDWPVEESIGFAATEPDIYEEEETGKWRREQTRQNPPSQADKRMMRRIKGLAGRAKELIDEGYTGGEVVGIIVNQEAVSKPMAQAAYKKALTQNPPRKLPPGARRGGSEPMTEAELARYSPEERNRYRKAYAYYLKLAKDVKGDRYEHENYAAHMAKSALLYPEGRYWDR